MALAAKVKKENYSYETYVNRIDSKAIKAAKNSFSDFREQGIILNDSFDDRIWLITDEAEKCSINFGISEITFESNCRYRLGCTFKQYSISMRVLSANI